MEFEVELGNDEGSAESWNLFQEQPLDCERPNQREHLTSKT